MKNRSNCFGLFGLVLLWFVIFCISIYVLNMVHGVGQKHQRSAEAQRCVEQAEASLATGDWSEAEHLIDRALAVNPAVALTVMEQLYAQIKAVPGVWDKLEECLLNHGEREKAILAMARLAAIQGRWEDAIVHTKAAADAGNEEAVWLQGNLAMQRGDFAVAHFAFDKYWYQTVDGSERQQVASEVCNEYHGQLEACIHALIMRGLWREAFKKASEREEPTPTEQFVSILHLDVFGDKPNEVIENYRRLLAEHTGYWLARRRLEFLDGTD